MLNDKIEEAKRKKNVLIARKKRAEAQKASRRRCRGLSDTSAFETFDRMAAEDRPDRGRGRGRTRRSRRSTRATCSSRSSATLEQTAGADEELEELKREMGVLPPVQAETRVEAPAEAEVNDAELAELEAALDELKKREATR